MLCKKKCVSLSSGTVRPLQQSSLAEPTGNFCHGSATAGTARHRGCGHGAPVASTALTTSRDRGQVHDRDERGIAAHTPVLVARRTEAGKSPAPMGRRQNEIIRVMRGGTASSSTADPGSAPAVSSHVRSRGFVPHSSSFEPCVRAAGPFASGLPRRCRLPRDWLHAGSPAGSDIFVGHCRAELVDAGGAGEGQTPWSHSPG
mmetsp:Transcript_4451/g.11704  ORF Transcript_4451/g.11704 Transcript_4451/m.11704 type:complete len:202 (-) Transcript_4451:259-864(-)